MERHLSIISGKISRNQWGHGGIWYKTKVEMGNSKLTTLLLFDDWVTSDRIIPWKTRSEFL